MSWLIVDFFILCIAALAMHIHRERCLDQMSDLREKLKHAEAARTRWAAVAERFKEQRDQLQQELNELRGKLTDIASCSWPQAPDLPDEHHGGTCEIPGNPDFVGSE